MSTSSLHSPITSLPYPERAKKLLNTWEQLSAGTAFAGINPPQFMRCMQPYEAYCYDLQKARAQGKEARIKRDAVEKEIRQFLSNLGHALQLSPEFGPDSAFYRVLGYVPTSERKSARSRTSTAATDPAAAAEAGTGTLPADPATTTPEPGSGYTAPSSLPVLARAERVYSFWQSYAIGPLFGLEQQKLLALITTLREHCLAVEESCALSTGLILKRETARKRLAEVTNRVIADIAVHPNFGTDSPLYQALGYVPGSQRRGGMRLVPIDATWMENVMTGKF